MPKAVQYHAKNIKGDILAEVTRHNNSNEHA